MGTPPRLVYLCELIPVADAAENCKAICRYPITIMADDYIAATNIIRALYPACSASFHVKILTVMHISAMEDLRTYDWSGT